ncbi:MAG: sugar ABC transporter permease [Tissierellia bacterium]|nr:sugar ABC transporter permease [Tissierellia bacterium]
MDKQSVTMQRLREAEQKPPRRLKSILAPYLFLLPALLLIGFWVYKPLVQTLQLATYDWSLVPGTTAEFVELDNFSKLLRNAEFWPAVNNTIFYTVGMLPFSVIIPLFLAAATQSIDPKAQRIYRALFFIPMIMAPVSTAVIFRWLFNPGNGLINQTLLNLGLVDRGIAFFSDPNWARLIILFIAGWKMIGFATLMYSSALTGINGEYYEAAKLDGASEIRQFFDITLPLLSPTTMLMIMISVLFSSQWTFAYIDNLTMGGPFSTSTNIYYMMYRFAFAEMNVGLSAAAAAMFMVVFGVLALILQYLNRKLAFYDN